AVYQESRHRHDPERRLIRPPNEESQFPCRHHATGAARRQTCSERSAGGLLGQQRRRRLGVGPDVLLGYRSQNGDGSWFMVRILDTTTGSELLPPFGGQTLAVEAGVFTSDGQRLTTASQDKTIRIWELTTGHEVLKATGHASIVQAVRLSPDGRRLISASSDRPLRVWDAAPLAEWCEKREYDSEAMVDEPSLATN